MRLPRLTRKGRRRQALAHAKKHNTVHERFYSESRTTGRIRYYLDGPEDADVTVVFIHGFTLAASAWHLQVAHVAHEARCVLMDLRGHGSTGEYSVEDCTLDGAADDVARVLEAVKPNGPLVIVGHSLGGMVAINFLRRYPEFRTHTAGLVLVATAVDSFASQGVPQVLALPVAEKIRNAVEASPAETATLRESIAALVAPTLAVTVFQTPMPPSVIDFHAQLINETPLSTFVGFLDDLQEHEEVEGARLLSGIEGVVIVGEKDSVTPLSQAQRIVSLWPDAGLQVAPDTGHMIILEQPAIVNKAIDQMIEHAHSVGKLPTA
ncbi:alpha/beta fold hydrolase [Corynebacterium ulcerans]|nr:alpha/beta hydrolase [Corynebacterium ulcerans]AIT89607.1 Alpha/beta hydrolase [Corynebacterium ulcerans]AIU30891.1 Alpha/beta hydrolase [Corynebacterium ulcerans]ALD95395.1 Alpha/beta hydrolase [Corynebacterium ulcerans]KPH74805.1 alpha/beta hydrolase [Corynebacterium ulcerans]MBH5297950.1 alpha/beta hydrolase [Corynebacterium ulcerans]